MACLTLASSLAVRPRAAGDRARVRRGGGRPRQPTTAMGGIVMTTRRDFLKAGTAAVTTGIVFCSCGLKQSAHAEQPVRQKLPVMVGGNRVKTTDVHPHRHFREAGPLLPAHAAAHLPPPTR